MLNNDALTVMADALADAAGYLALHSGNPGTSGDNETAADRVAADWPAATGSGDLQATGKQFAGGTPNGPVTHVGFWSDASGGTFYGSAPLAESGDLAFNAAGEYTVETVTIDGSADGSN